MVFPWGVIIWIAVLHVFAGIVNVIFDLRMEKYWGGLEITDDFNVDTKGIPWYLKGERPKSYVEKPSVVNVSISPSVEAPSDVMSEVNLERIKLESDVKASVSKLFDKSGINL